MRLYLSGNMDGMPDNNFAAFRGSAKRLREAGYEVVSPHELDLEMGILPGTIMTRQLREIVLDRDLEALSQCDGVAVIDGTKPSNGVSREILRAVEQRKPIALVSAWLEAATKKMGP